MINWRTYNEWILYFTFDIIKNFFGSLAKWFNSFWRSRNNQFGFVNGWIQCSFWALRGFSNILWFNKRAYMTQKSWNTILRNIWNPFLFRSRSGSVETFFTLFIIFVKVDFSFMWHWRPTWRWRGWTWVNASFWAISKIIMIIKYCICDPDSG